MLNNFPIETRRAVTRRAVIEAVHEERERQDNRWGPLPRGLTQGDWLGVLGEEFGEVCTETITLHAPGMEPDYEKLSAELIQVAAVAIAWVEELGLTDD